MLTATARAADPAAWQGFHLVHHGGRDRLLREAVAPLVASLAGEGEIAGFFFVRYDLGGPHVRLRLRPRPGREAAVADRVHAAAADFFAREPSIEVDAEKVRRENAVLRASDPTTARDGDDVFPDHSVQVRPVRFEHARYGGASAFARSLPLFALSSLDALRFLAAAEPTAGARLAAAQRALVRLAWGFAGDAEDFARMAAYAAHSPPAPLVRFVAAADDAFERGRDALCERLRAELAGLTASGDDDPLAAGALRLSCELRGMEDAARRRIAVSHLHMSANRLGLRNPEEVYLARMLSRAARALADAEPAFWRGVWDARRERLAAAASGQPLWRRARSELAGFTAHASSITE